MSNDPILLVEDDENDITFMRYALEKVGLHNPLHVVTDGGEAIDYPAGSGQYSNREMHPLPWLVLLDLNLPNRNGFEVLEWIRGQRRIARLACNCADRLNF